MVAGCRPDGVRGHWTSDVVVVALLTREATVAARVKKGRRRGIADTSNDQTGLTHETAVCVSVVGAHVVVSVAADPCRRRRRGVADRAQLARIGSFMRYDPRAEPALGSIVVGGESGIGANGLRPNDAPTDDRPTGGNNVGIRRLRPSQRTIC